MHEGDSDSMDRVVCCRYVRLFALVLALAGASVAVHAVLVGDAYAAEPRQPTLRPVDDQYAGDPTDPDFGPKTSKLEMDARISEPRNQAIGPMHEVVILRNAFDDEVRFYLWLLLWGLR